VYVFSDFKNEQMFKHVFIENLLSISDKFVDRSSVEIMFRSRFGDVFFQVCVESVFYAVISALVSFLHYFDWSTSVYITTILFDVHIQ